jgi:hypothetical protein
LTDERGATESQTPLRTTSAAMRAKRGRAVRMVRGAVREVSFVAAWRRFARRSLKRIGPTGVGVRRERGGERCGVM